MTAQPSASAPRTLWHVVYGGPQHGVMLRKLERAGGFTTNVAQGRAYALAQMAGGASELRDLVVLAWRASADAEVGWRPVKVRDVEAGTADPYNSLYAVD